MSRIQISMHKMEMILERLEIAFLPCRRNQRERNQVFDLYFEKLKYIDEFLLSLAVNFLIDNRTEKSFPKVAEIIKAIETVRDQIPDGPGGGCPKCQDQGFVTVPYEDEPWRSRGYVKAVPCDCRLGRKIEGNLRRKDSKKAILHRRRRRGSVNADVDQIVRDTKKTVSFEEIDAAAGDDYDF